MARTTAAPDSELYLILTDFHLSSRMWLVATVVDRAIPQGTEMLEGFLLEGDLSVTLCPDAEFSP